MEISVRPIRYDSESQALVDTLQANLPHLPHGRLFEWLYLNNPEGRALVWVAAESGTNRLVGVAAAFPRRIYYRGEVLSGYVLGDFCIDAEHRSLGLALKLQRACVEGLSGLNAGFAFDFPSTAMLAIYKRLRVDVNASMTRYAKPLRIDRKVAERIPVPSMARGLSAVGNAGLRLRDKGLPRNRDWTVTEDKGPWGNEFTQAAEAWSTPTGACVMRTAEYLNWRFREHPLQEYEMLAARQGTRLLGYLIQHKTGEDSMIDDLMAQDDEVRRALLSNAVEIARKRQLHTVSIPWLSEHAGRQVLEERGFSARESSPVILLPLPGKDQRELEPGVDWRLTCGDWES